MGAGGAVGGAVTISLTYSYLRRWQIESSHTRYLRERCRVDAVEPTAVEGTSQPRRVRTAT